MTDLAALVAVAEDKTLSVRGWDGYDAEPLSTDAVSAMRELLTRLDAPEPFVVPIPNGDVQAEWDAEPAGVYIEVEAHADGTYSTLIGDEERERVDIDTAVQEIEAALRKWAGGEA